MSMPRQEGAPLNAAVVAAEAREMPADDFLEEFGAVTRAAGAPFSDGQVILSNLIQDRGPEASPRTEETEIRYAVYCRELVRRSVSYLGLTPEDLFGDEA